MKALEEKIINAVAKNASSGILSISQSVLKAIEPTVKDIAIEFAEKCFDEYADQQMSFGELFDQFIKERYK